MGWIRESKKLGGDDDGISGTKNTTTTDSSFANTNLIRIRTRQAATSPGYEDETWNFVSSTQKTVLTFPSRGKNNTAKLPFLTRPVRTALTDEAGRRNEVQDKGREGRKGSMKTKELNRMMKKSGSLTVVNGAPAESRDDLREMGRDLSTPLPNTSFVDGDADEVAGVSKRLLDIHQISSRLHRSFPWEGLGLHQNGSGNSLTATLGFNPIETPHTILFSSFYIFPIILLVGVVIGVIWLICACFYHTMWKIKFALCPGRSGNEEKRGKKRNNKGGGDATNQMCGMENKPQILTPEILEMRRQERLSFLQEECANLEQQLKEEKSATLTSRASDSDLEYLGASESPPLKRNSISLQDIPQSVIRIRREKELRQIKEEIEYLRSIAQQEKEKALLGAKGLKGSLLITQDFELELPGSKPGSPGESKVEPLSQHISHLKTQRKITEIRNELEDLAIQLLHADEIKAKRNSLQELPRTAINIKREQNIISMSNEIQKIKNYKLQKKNVIETALEKSNNSPKGGNQKESGKQSGSKSFNTNATPSTSEDTAAKYSDPEFVHRASIRRQREQELNRVRVELKDLAYKLNLNPMNYISEDRVRLVPSQSMQSTSSAVGQSFSYNKATSSSSALNHV